MLYEHLGLGSLPGENVLIASALWGFVRPSDRIPAYRLSMGATLPRIPSLPALWRDPLRRALPDSGLIVDLRSGSYAAAWKPKQATVVGVRAFVDGKTVSHMVKATRGDVARILLTSGETPETPEDVASIVRQAGLTVELNDALPRRHRVASANEPRARTRRPERVCTSPRSTSPSRASRSTRRCCATSSPRWTP